MYAVSTEIVFQAGHYLQLDQQQEKAHQHDWRIRVTVQAEQLDRRGLVMDFHLLEDLLAKVVEPLSKVPSVNDLPEFAELNPSTENLARYIYDNLAVQLPGEVSLSEVELWEMSHCRATYRP